MALAPRAEWREGARMARRRRRTIESLIAIKREISLSFSALQHQQQPTTTTFASPCNSSTPPLLVYLAVLLSLHVYCERHKFSAEDFYVATARPSPTRMRIFTKARKRREREREIRTRALGLASFNALLLAFCFWLCHIR